MAAEERGGAAERSRVRRDPEPLAVVERRDDVTGFRSRCGVDALQEREDRLRTWLATGGTIEQFDEDHPECHVGGEHVRNNSQ